MAGLFGRLFGRERDESERGSSSTAKERLQFILVHDRIHLPPDRMEEMKREILQVISKYVDVDGDNVDIALQKRDRNSMLVAEVPFIKPIPTLDDEEEEDDTPRTRPVDSSPLLDDA